MSTDAALDLPAPTVEYLESWSRVEDVFAYRAGSYAAFHYGGRYLLEYAAMHLADGETGARRAMIALAGYVGIPRAEVLP